MFVRKARICEAIEQIFSAKTIHNGVIIADVNTEHSCRMKDVS